MFSKTALAAAILACAVQAAEKPIPRILATNGEIRLEVDGSPYLMLGGQVHNSTTSNAQDLARALDVLTGLHANTAEVPVYWELIEPKPGVFDFRIVDEALAAARKRNLRLVLLWFGTWKNGESHYVPEWVKRDKAKYTRVRGARGEETSILSPLCDAARDADVRAFSAVMRHLRSADEAERTVILVQVENEPGLLGTDRDYSEAASRRFAEQVPPELMAFLGKTRERLSAGMRTAWGAQQFRTSGTWSEVFGEHAAEVFTAWSVARYVNSVAEAGRKEYPLPLFSNAWLIEGVERAGMWPSGGATEHVLDVWKAAAPAIDLLAPDIYYPNFYEVASQYSRPDNALFVPETNFNPYFAGFAYLAFGGFRAIGFCPFGIDDVAKGGAAAAAAGAQFEDTYRVLSPLLPLIARHQYGGKIHPVLQGLGPGEAWKHSIRVGHRLAANVEFTIPFNPEQGRGRGMILELAPDDFVVAGAGFTVTFRELDGPLRDAEVLSIEEGTFDRMNWIPERRWNGDERHVSLPEKSTILRVRVARP